MPNAHCLNPGFGDLMRRRRADLGLQGLTATLCGVLEPTHPAGIKLTQRPPIYEGV